jgi:hypothetical protein
MEKRPNSREIQTGVRVKDEEKELRAKSNSKTANSI